MNYSGTTIYDISWQNPAKSGLPNNSYSSNGDKRTRRLLFGFLRGLGSGLVLVAVAMLIISFTPIIKQELDFRLSPRPSPAPESAFGLLIDSAVAAKRNQAIEDASLYDVPTDFSIVIPKISAASPVIPNIDPADNTIYEAALKSGVAHAAGSKFPGQKGTIYFFAHSTDSPLNVTRYNAVFYLLKELEIGDTIIVFFAGQEYKYKVSNHFITDANDTSWLTNDTVEQEQLILQTCWPPGTAWKRLLVIAVPQ